MPSGWFVSAEVTTSTLVRALSRVGGLICMAQADQFKAMTKTRRQSSGAEAPKDYFSEEEVHLEEAT